MTLASFVGTGMEREVEHLMAKVLSSWKHELGTATHRVNQYTKLQV